MGLLRSRAGLNHPSHFYRDSFDQELSYYQTLNQTFPRHVEGPKSLMAQAEGSR